MDKPRIYVERTDATNTGGIPLLYDSGHYYDEAGLYYDRWYDATGNLKQGEKPIMSVSKDSIGTKVEKETIMNFSEKDDIRVEVKKETIASFPEGD